MSKKLELGQIGFGARAWGAKRMWGYGKDFSDKDLLEVVRFASSSEVGFFDTAEIYGGGQSEQLLGNYISEMNSDVIIATKYAPFPWRIGAKPLRKALENSLSRLGLEQVDLYQIHWPWPLTSIEKLMDELADSVNRGLVKAVGVSNYNKEQMKEAHQALAKWGIPLTSNQVKFSLIHRKPELSGLLELCHELGIVLIAYGPLAEGMLSNKYSPDNPPKGPRRRKYNQPFLSKLQPVLHLLKDIGERHGGKTPSQVALNWVITKGAIPIPGIKTKSQAEENLGAIGWQLEEEEINALDHSSSSFFQVIHQR